MTNSLRSKLETEVRHENFLGAIDLLAAHAPSIDLSSVRGKFDEYIGTKGSKDSYEAMERAGQFSGMGRLAKGSSDQVEYLKGQLGIELKSLIEQITESSEISDQ